MQHFGKAALRVTKNYTKGYSDTQAKVRDATSNDPWGPSGTQMNEIAQLTYNQNDFIEIMEMLDKRLNDKGKNWRHVFKSLTVLDYCLHQGSENVVIYFRDNVYVIKTLKEFQYIDEDGKDQGANVRQKAKDITNLLQDESRLREERRSRASMRDRMIRGSGAEGADEMGIDDENASRRQPGTNGLAGKRPNRDEDELKRAIEESKKSLALERQNAEDRDLKEALRLSQEEEEKRKNDVENSNASALFDDSNQLPPPSATSSNNPFPLIDPTPYAVGLQPQFTVQPQFTSMAPQFTSFNPYQQQIQAEQEAAQAEYLRQQQMFMLQQQQAQQQQQQQEEWLRQQQMLQMQQQQQQQQQQQSLFIPQQQPVMAQPTGFGNNNPFAPAMSPSPSAFSPSPQPQQQNQPTFNLQGTYDTHSPSQLSSLSSSPQPPHSSSVQGRPIAVKTRQDEDGKLASLFAERESGQDTFGNIGALRYGYTDAGRSVLAQKTGASHNPFAMQQQQQQQQQQAHERPFFDI